MDGYYGQYSRGRPRHAYSECSYPPPSRSAYFGQDMNTPRGRSSSRTITTRIRAASSGYGPRYGNAPPLDVTIKTTETTTEDPGTYDPRSYYGSGQQVARPPMMNPYMGPPPMNPYNIGPPPMNPHMAPPVMNPHMNPYMNPQMGPPIGPPMMNGSQYPAGGPMPGFQYRHISEHGPPRRLITDAHQHAMNQVQGWIDSQGRIQGRVQELEDDPRGSSHAGSHRAWVPVILKNQLDRPYRSICRHIRLQQQAPGPQEEDVLSLVRIGLRTEALSADAALDAGDRSHAIIITNNLHILHEFIRALVQVEMEANQLRGVISRSLGRLHTFKLSTETSCT
ncbi:hypothetical protein F4777DRAFT_575122 [Nemania sp. FL0916]|nr:hypothetical protein F4777DRAFT_575122 [Nemania sp. FL0916]